MALRGVKPNARAEPSNTELVVLAFVVLEIVLFQLSVPVFSDEAYLLSWGLHPAPGYYDHPPLTGWVSAGILWVDAVLGLGRPILAGRAFALILGAVSALLLYRRMTQFVSGDQARRLVLTWALIPGTLVYFNMYLNDLLVVFQGLIFVLALHSLWRRQSVAPGVTAIAALALAGMLLTKYSSAIIFLGGLAGLAWDAPGRRFLIARMLPVAALASVPFLWHLWWNLQNCSVNFAFNFFFRNESATGGPVVAWLATLYLTTGVIGGQFLWRLGRRRLGRPGFLTRIFLGTIGVAAAIALARGTFGGNWGAPFAGLAILALAETAPGISPRTALRGNLGIGAVLVLPALLATLALKIGIAPPGKYLPEASAYRFALLQDLGGGALAPDLRRLAEGRVTGSDSYGLTALLALGGLQPAVTLSRSVYGRNDDLFTDYAALDGRDFLLLPARPQNGARLAQRFFAAWREVRIAGGRGEYTVILADNFDYSAFRAEILEPFIRDRYLASPFPYRACPVKRYLSSP